MQELQLEEVYGIRYTSFWRTPIGTASLIGTFLLALLLLYVLMRAIQIYRLGSKKDQALRMLRVLNQKLERNQLTTSRAYQELTTILKGYARWRYDMPRGVTDYELTTWLTHAGCEKGQCSGVERVMADAQAIKFGAATAPKKQAQEDVLLIISFVEAVGEKQ
jgi:hypothetical protein